MKKQLALKALSQVSVRACGPRNHMKISQSQAIIHDGSERRDRAHSGEPEAVQVSDPERA
jgi:hypothetical protein